ncbi:hypothetical protein AB0J83_11180 [Actinoplanes sp. NPDC049596]|uniref:hypothetical protein n=1 Tax=unclassified Actinoplanes TaxID=2626549 RepID=UPI003423907D
MRRTITILAAAGLIAATGCTKKPQQVGGEAFPVGGTSPSPSAIAAPTVTRTPSSPTSSSPASSPRPSTTSAKPKPKVTRVIGPANVLGPTGLGKLQIGMTPKEAEATGLVRAGEGDAGCGSWYLNKEGAGDATVGYTSRGVVSIPAYGRIATPEGIRIGSSLADAERTYADLSGQAADRGSTWGEGLAYGGQTDEYANVHYRFTFVRGAVASLALKHDKPEC